MAKVFNESGFAGATDADKAYFESAGTVAEVEKALSYASAVKPKSAVDGLTSYARAGQVKATGTAFLGNVNNLSKSNAWQAIEKEFFEMKGTKIAANMSKETDRLEKFIVKLNLNEQIKSGENFMMLDASKSHVNAALMQRFLALLKDVKFDAARQAMFSGVAINTTEQRSVLHTALRNVSPGAVVKDNTGTDVMPGIRAVWAKLKPFVERVRSGEWKGHSGKAVKYVVNIGIGGSDLGPAMACDALKPYNTTGLKMVFVSNVDGSHISEALRQVNIEETLFTIASKTFTTVETLRNANTARDALLAHYGGDSSAVAKHFVAVSTNAAKVQQFGIDVSNMFGFWDWVGGRYSMWSAIGLPIALSIGWHNFEEMLTGAHAMDEHFLHAPAEANLPVLMALTSIYYNNLVGCETHAVLPYSQYLHRLPAYLQQLDMESNGKTALQGDHSLTAVDMHTGPIIFGEPGTNGQHAFYQLLHQGTRVVPIDFIGTLETQDPVADLMHHKMLLANMFAQAEALMNGKSVQAARKELGEMATPPPSDVQERLVSHKAFVGDRPSNTFLIGRLTPRAFGALIAAYEQKVFTMGVVWGINSFDQFGVELGKVLATAIQGQLVAGEPGVGHDASTNNLITIFNQSLKAVSSA